MHRRLVKKRPISPQEYAKGVLHQDIGDRVFDLQLYEPDARLKPWIEFYWSVQWDLGNSLFEQIVITNPTVDLSLEDDPGTNGPGLKVFVTGVEPKAYIRRLTGAGQVFAVHFAPGMFRSWWPEPVSRITGRVLQVPCAGQPWEQSVLDVIPKVLRSERSSRSKLLDSILLKHLPQRDPMAEEIRDLVHLCREDPTLWSTEAMASRRAYAVRTNQRHFLEYVGVGPKWIIRRFRIQKAIDMLDEDRKKKTKSDLASIAQSLGYFDHAHFTREFGAVAGISPSAYREKKDPNAER